MSICFVTRKSKCERNLVRRREIMWEQSQQYHGQHHNIVKGIAVPSFSLRFQSHLSFNPGILNILSLHSVRHTLFLRRLL